MQINVHNENMSADWNKAEVMDKVQALSPAQWNDTHHISHYNLISRVFTDLSRVHPYI